MIGSEMLRVWQLVCRFNAIAVLEGCTVRGIAQPQVGGGRSIPLCGHLLCSARQNRCEMLDKGLRVSRGYRGLEILQVDMVGLGEEETQESPRKSCNPHQKGV